MNIHEHQAKDLLRSFGVPVANGRAITAFGEAASAIQELSGPIRVVKAQIHAGGRGKGRFADAPEGAPGGVRVTKSSEEAEQAVADMLGRTLVTHQTGPEGKKVQRVYVEEGCDIRRELYLALLIDRGTSRLSFVASTEGGMDIEEVAASTPERILTVTIDPASGISDFHARKIAFGLGLTGPAIRDCRNLVSKLYEMFVSKDCELVEINPLVVDGEDRLICLDAKVSFDGNALDRHPDIKALRDLAEEDEREVSASEFGLNYIALDGEIGCLVNGAGLAMATMDIIKLYGSEPANFPRCRRRRDPRTGDRGLQAHHLGPQGQGNTGEHFRRHHAVRRDRRRNRLGSPGRRASRPAGGSTRRHQCRDRTGDPEQQRSWHFDCERSRRCCAADHRRSQSITGRNPSWPYLWTRTRG